MKDFKDLLELLAQHPEFSIIILGFFILYQVGKNAGLLKFLLTFKEKRINDNLNLLEKLNIIKDENIKEYLTNRIYKKLFFLTTGIKANKKERGILNNFYKKINHIFDWKDIKILYKRHIKINQGKVILVKKSFFEKLIDIVGVILFLVILILSTALILYTTSSGKTLENIILAFVLLAFGLSSIAILVFWGKQHTLRNQLIKTGVIEN